MLRSPSTSLRCTTRSNRPRLTNNKEMTCTNRSSRGRMSTRTPSTSSLETSRRRGSSSRKELDSRLRG
jgi:hypothetical protein